MMPVAYGLHWPRLPSWRGGGFGTGTRHWAPALVIGIEFSFSLFRIQVYSFSFSLDRQTIELLHSFSFALNIWHGWVARGGAC